MSWLLTLDRGKRGNRKDVNYNDKEMWSSILKEPDEDDPRKKPEQKKRKRGRPPRSQTPDQHMMMPPEQKKRRGRPPKVRPATPQKEFSLQQEQNAPKRIGRIASEPVRQVKQNETEYDDYVDYVYEYEYEYEEEEKKEVIAKPVEKLESEEKKVKEEKKETEEIKVKEEKTEQETPKTSPVRGKGRGAPRAKKEANDDGEFFQEDAEMFSLEEIVGVKDVFGRDGEEPEYLVKFENRSYAHCRWVSKEELLKFDDGASVLKEFTSRCEETPLEYSLSVPGVMICDEADLNPIWYEVERVLREAIGFNAGVGYLCKWRGLEYDKSTLEQRSVVHDPSCISAFMARQKHRNPLKIPTRWVRPKPELYQPLTEKPVSKRGEVMKDFQLEGLNWLIKCWFEQKNTILGDDTRAGKVPQAVAMLSWLSKTYNVSGPFLVLASNLDRWQQAFEDWSDLNAIVFAGSVKSRQWIFENECEIRDEHDRTESDFIQCDVIITTYELFLTCFHQHFERIEWRYIMIDDGAKMSNSRGRVRKLLNTCRYEHMSLLMEWPIKKLTAAQRNVIKIYFLLNFLDSPRFNNINEFLEKYSGPDEDSDLNSELLSIIDSYMLERDKEAIEEAMSPKKETFVLCQPSLVQGKLVATDKLLPLFMAERRKVVIFSQMVRVLDVLEVYMNVGQLPFLRIDCSLPVDKRLEVEEQFRKSECQILLLSTKPDSYHLPIDLGDVILVYDNDSYIFLQETKAKIYHLITDGSFEMQMWGPDADHVCFDKTVITACEGDEPSWMDAQDIELMLRSSIQSMYSTDDDAWASFCAMSGEELLEKCTRDSVVAEKSEINIKKQTDFWTIYLEPPQKKTQSIDSEAVELEFVTKLAQGLNDRGFRGGEDELKLLKCALTLAPPEDKKSLDAIQKIVGDNSSDEPMKRFTQSYFMVEKLAKKFFESVIFFSKLPKALYYTTLPGFTWPSVKPLWEDAGCEYALLYAVAENGYKNLGSVPEAKSLSRAQIEKRVASLAKKILDQFPDVEVPADFVPLEPEEWKEMHPSIIKRTSLTPEEVLAVFNYMKGHGVPHLLVTHEIDIPRMISYLKMDEVSPDALDLCVSDIIGLTLSLRKPDSEPSYKQYQRAKPLRKQVDVEEIRDLMLVCRLMEKVYAFAQDFDIEKEPAFQYVRLKNAPEWWTPDHSRSLVLGLLEYGVDDLESWYADERINITPDQINEFLSTPEARLRLASSIVSQTRGYAGVSDPTVEGSYILKSSANLRIESFGRVVNSPAFRARNYPYPVGLTTQRLMVRSIPDVPHVWYRCEIQAIGPRPIFVISPLDDPSNDFADLSPMEAWMSMIKAIAGDAATDAVRKLKLSRDWPLGLTPSVIETIQERARLAGVHFSTDESQSEESDDDMEFKPDH